MPVGGLGGVVTILHGYARECGFVVWSFRGVEELSALVEPRLDRWSIYAVDSAVMRRCRF